MVTRVVASETGAVHVYSVLAIIRNGGCLLCFDDFSRFFHFQF